MSGGRNSRAAELYEPLAPRPPEERVDRDQAYGAHARHQLDLFAPERAQAAPVLLFVHGGGFVRGDKGGTDRAFYNNVGAWCMGEGVVGVTMTYRLAPWQVSSFPPIQTVIAGLWSALWNCLACSLSPEVTS